MHSGASFAGWFTRGLAGYTTPASPGSNRLDAFHEDDIADGVL
jgi:hypothetical protein